MNRNHSQTPPVQPDGPSDLDPLVMIPVVMPHEIEPVAIGDDVYDPRSDSERFPMPEDMPPVITKIGILNSEVLNM